MGNRKQRGYIGSIISAVGSLAGSAMSASSQGGANRTNVKLQRENQNWQAMMANTAMQRRVKDLELAGLNPVLAAGGSGAATPSVASATVEPKIRENPGLGIASAVALHNQKKMQDAQIELTTQQGRVAKVTADNAEKFGGKNAEFDNMIKFNKVELGDLEIIAKRIANATNEITKDMTAAQLEQFNKVKGDLAKAINNQAREGTANVEALENIAKMGGLEAGMAAKVVSAIILALKGK